jgi:hypothetical protein
MPKIVKIDMSTVVAHGDSGVTGVGKYIPPQNELKRDPFEHMRLALKTRGVEFKEPAKIITLNTPLK